MKIITMLSIPMFGLLLVTGIATAQPTVSATGQSLVVDGVVAENGAILKVAGPDGYRLMQDIAQGASATIESLQPGTYHYEVLSRPGGEKVNGSFSIGSVSSPESQTDRVSEEEIVLNGTNSEDWLAVSDNVNDGITTFDLDSDGATLDLHWTIVNQEGTLKFQEHDRTDINAGGTGTTNVSFMRQSLLGGIGIGTELSLHPLSIVHETPVINMTDTDGGTNWKLINSDGKFILSSNCTGDCEFGERWDVVVVEEGSAEHSLVINSSGVSVLSSRDAKTNIKPTSAEQVLAELEKLPIYTWSYTKDGNKAVHIGPMAEEFHQQFGFGDDEKRISALDTGGLALAGVKALQQKLDKRDAEIEELKETVALLLEKVK